MTDELKPCFSCDSTDLPKLDVKGGPADDPRYQAVCCECGAAGPWKYRVKEALAAYNAIPRTPALNPMSEPPEGTYAERRVMVVEKLGGGRIAGKIVKFSEGWHNRKYPKWVGPFNADQCAGWIELPKVKTNDH